MENENKDLKEANSEVNSEESATSTNDVEQSKTKKSFLIEGIIALVAVVVIIAAVILSKNGSKKVVPDETYGPMPAIPEIAALNPIDEAVAKEKVAAGEMIELKGNNGTVYVANYKDQALFSEKITAKQEDIDDLINTGILAGFAEQAEITGRDDVQMGDTVNIDYVGTIDGVAFDGGTGNYDLTIGSHSFIDTFEDQLVGAKVGDVVEVHVTFPENYGKEELNGKPALFTVTVNELLHTTVNPELTDELVTEFFTGMGEDVTTVEGCYEYCTNYIEEFNVYGFISDAFYASNVDKDVVTSFYNDTIGYYGTMAENYGTDLETLLASNGQTVDDIKNDIVKNAAQSALYIEVINAIAKDLGITLTDDDLLKFAQEQGATSVEEYYEMYGSEATLGYYALEAKVIETLKNLY